MNELKEIDFTQALILQHLLEISKILLVEHCTGIKKLDQKITFSDPAKALFFMQNLKLPTHILETHNRSYLTLCES